MKDLPPLIRVPALAELLSLTPHGVRAMIRRGELPAVRVGRQWIVRRESLERHLGRLESKPSRHRAEDAAARLMRALPPPRRTGRR